MSYDQAYRVLTMPFVKVSARGQITLPAALRREFGLAPGSTVEVTVVEGGLLVRPLKSIRQLSGIFSDRIPPGGPLGWEEERRMMEEAVAREVVGRCRA
jgi:AbrB family looped-hinge helix DNA binding protein